MSRSPAGRLKVFQAQIGFYDTVVAAPSQAAALRAWGTHQNLFASGQAQSATDPAAIAAAILCPDQPLRRAVGTDAAFVLEPTSLPALPDPPPKRRRQAAPVPPQPAPDRSALDRAEAALGAIEDQRRAEEAEFRRQEAALAAHRATAQAAYAAARGKARAAVEAARRLYREAGGRD